MSATATATRIEPADASARPVVFVFETNLAGNLDHGIPRLAAVGYGAQPGLGSGASGRAFALPTANSQGRPLSVEVVRSYVLDFMNYAQARPEVTFRLGLIGQNLGPADRERILPFFEDAPKNCQLPASWLVRFGRLKLHRLLIGSGAANLANPEVAANCAEYVRMNAPLWGSGSVELLSTGNANVLVTVDRFAKANQLTHRVVSVDEKLFGPHANLAREELALWHATRVISLTRADETSPGHEMRLIAAAARSGVPIEEVFSD